jgi:hypothetical protein
MTNEQKVEIIKDFLLYCKEFLKIERLPKIRLLKDHDWVLTYRSFGKYEPSSNTLFVYIGNRNLADIFRTISHELVHHKQGEEGRLTRGSGNTGSEIENEANAYSGIIMRNYGQKNELIYESSLTQIIEISKNTRFTIFCDMDGVLCNFDAQFDHYYGKSATEYSKEKGPELLRQAVNDIGEKFWSEMPWIPGSKVFWEYISAYSPIILSSPSTFTYAQKGKLNWIKRNLDPQPESIIFKQTGFKHEVLSDYNPKNCILIDDYFRNTMPWKEAGGIGITYKNPINTIEILKKFGL